MEDAQFFLELYEIVKQNKAEDFDGIIMEKASYPYLYHLSEIRQNLIDWIPFSKEMRVLERNAECGALTPKLLSAAGEVISIAPDEIRADIIKARCGCCGRLKVLLEDDWATGREEAEKFDVILLSGSFYRYTGELSLYRRLLKPQGRLIAADANRIGMKYLAGCQEEYAGGYFTGIEGYPTKAAGQRENAGCYTRKEYETLLEGAGFFGLKFYYPYPDHKFPSCIYSDLRLPKKGELSDNRRNFDRDRYQLFDERLAYDTILKEGLFGELANSFLIEARSEPSLPAGDASRAGRETVYSKFANERASRFGIRTDIVRMETGEYSVSKHALREAGNAHIDHIRKAYDWLKQEYGQSNIRICPCRKAEDAVSFPFLGGRTLQEEIERLVKEDEPETVERILKEYVRRICGSGMEKPFRRTDGFTEVFGEREPQGGCPCAGVSDIDMIFSNILLGEGEAWSPKTVWTVIDYEWTFDFPVPRAFILYRAFYFAYHQILHQTAWDLDRLLALADISREEAEIFSGMEEHFQIYLGKGALPVRNMQRLMGTSIRLLPEADPVNRKVSEFFAHGDRKIRVRELFCHIDRQEYQDGCIVISGWAFARARDGRCYPVELSVQDDGGKSAPAEIIRKLRKDVGEALSTGEECEPVWGFDCVWVTPPEKNWHVHFSLGRFEKIYDTAASDRQGRGG